MSVVAWRWEIANANKLPSMAKFVALTLSLSMTADGYCDKASGETIARRTGLSRRTVVNATTTLKTRGWLTVGKRQLRTGASGRINTYQARFPDWHRASEAQFNDPAF